MPQKLIDTTTSDNRAFRDIFSLDFKRFIRNKFSEKEILAINADEIAKKFHLKGIVFGNYVSQEERHFYLFKTAKQMECLAKIRGNNDLGKGKLILSIGAHGIGGRANAHYSPGENLINLARGNKGDYKSFMKGENSFVHEYGHFLDYEQGRNNDKDLDYNFASENLDNNWKNLVTRKFSEPISEIVEDKDYYDNLRTPYLKSRIEIFARLFEASLNHYINIHEPEYKKYFDRGYTEGIYYPKAKILAKNYDKKIVKILKH
jgi:hypothetical protein